MKKFLTLLLAGIMILSCMVAFSSCASKPELDLDDAEENLDDEDYYVSYSDDYDEPGKEARLYAYKGDDSIEIVVFSDSKLAGIYYDMKKAMYEVEKEYLEYEIKALEHILKKYDDDMKNDEIDDLEDELKEYKKGLEKLEEIVIGKSGKTVWEGTKDAIKDSKG